MFVYSVFVGFIELGGHLGKVSSEFQVPELTEILDPEFVIFWVSGDLILWVCLLVWRCVLK